MIQVGSSGLPIKLLRLLQPLQSTCPFCFALQYHSFLPYPPDTAIRLLQPTPALAHVYGQLDTPLLSTFLGSSMRLETYPPTYTASDVLVAMAPSALPSWYFIRQSLNV